MLALLHYHRYKLNLDDVTELMATRGIFVPDMITTDKEAAFEYGINEVFGAAIEHRKSKYMNNRLEQDHRAPKSRYHVMKGFKDEFSALSMTHSFEEIRQLFRMKGKTRAEKRKGIMSKFNNYCNLALIAS